MSDILVFDRQQVRRQRDRAAVEFCQHDFLFQENARRLSDRLLDTTRKFPLSLELGCHNGNLLSAIPPNASIDRLIQCDFSTKMGVQANLSNKNSVIVADEEFLPFADNTFDLVISNLSLHWVNDLPGCLLQIRRILKPDGLFLASIFAGKTLHELKSVMTDAEMSVMHGISPRFSPVADIREVGSLLQRAGFIEPVIDFDSILVTYRNPLQLLNDLQGMGEGNAILSRRKNFTKREILFSAMALYQERFADNDGLVPATFQTLNLTAWAPP